MIVSPSPVPPLAVSSSACWNGSKMCSRALSIIDGDDKDQGLLDSRGERKFGTRGIAAVVLDTDRAQHVHHRCFVIEDDGSNTACNEQSVDDLAKYRSLTGRQ